MRWIWHYVGTAFVLGAKDAWQTLGRQRVVISALAVVIAWGLVYWATGKPTAALLGAAAWPILLVAVGLIYYVGHLLGRDRLWTWHPQVTPDRTMINAQLRTKGGCSLSTVWPGHIEITSVVWDPAGRATRISDVSYINGRGFVYFSYPDLGPPAGQLAPGTYWISWQWRKPDRSKWHVYAAHRVVVGSLLEAQWSSAAGGCSSRAPYSCPA